VVISSALFFGLTQIAFPPFLEPPGLQNLGEVGNRVVIEAPFALLDEQVELLLRDALVLKCRFAWFQKFSIRLM